MESDQTAPTGAFRSRLIWVYAFKDASKTFQQAIKWITFVVIGILKVKSYYEKVYWKEEYDDKKGMFQLFTTKFSALPPTYMLL